MLAAIVAILGVYSCSSDNNDEPSYTQSYLNGKYEVGAEKNALIATIDGSAIESSSASVTFNTNDHKIADITLSNLIDGNEEIKLTNVALTENSEMGGYDFEGVIKIDNERITFSGNIVMNSLTISLTKTQVTL
jgi:hypothetical protein